MKLSERLKHIDYDGYVDKIIKKLKLEKQIFIFGAGSRAQTLARFLIDNGIVIDSFFVNRKYFVEGKIINIKRQEIPIKCFESEIEKLHDVTIVLGISSSTTDMNQFNKRAISDVISISLGTRDDYLMKKDFYNLYVDELDYLYNQLADDYSRDCMYAHFYGRLTGKDIPFKANKYSDPQYFFEEFMCWKESECYVDCGAYTGDSIEEFLIKMPQKIVKNYTIYAWEPDEENFKQLKRKYEKNKNINFLCLGAYSEETQLFFMKGDGELSALSSAGDIKINVDSIDKIMGKEKATFIKMDIEGSELEALKGAKNQIMNYSPRLAICVYHKKEDLITIPQLIVNYNPRYHLYLRPHSSMPTELTLFCIPET